MEKIKVLVVDDSFFMRKAISKILTTEDIEVIDTAANGLEAIEKAQNLNPDVITMDIEMPVMNGLDAVSRIVEVKQVPILMLSTLTSEGAEATIEALSRGAVDFITKKAAFSEMNSLADEIISKVRAIANSKSIATQIRRQLTLNKEKLIATKNKTIETNSESVAHKEIKKDIKYKRPDPSSIKIITIGISTGGPAALNEMIPKLPGNIPVPIVIAQHMPPFFTKSLAERLDSVSKLNVKEAVNNEKLLPGWVYIAPGGKQTTINRNFTLTVTDEPKDELFKPSVNVLVNSAVDSLNKYVVGIIMTGMGNDGAKALKRLHDVGGYVISQDIESCVVAGMPKAVIDQNIANEIHSLNELPLAIASLFNLSIYN